MGWPYAGADGVRGVVNVLRNELEMAMALTGRPTIASIDRSLILPLAGSPDGLSVERTVMKPGDTSVATTLDRACSEPAPDSS